MRRSALLSTLIEVFLPSLCVECELPLAAGDRGLCGACWARVVPVQGCRCHRCGGACDDDQLECLACNEAPPKQSATVVWGEHAGALRTAVLALKYGGRDELAVPLGRRLSANLAMTSWVDDIDQVVAVPSHMVHQLRRGWPAAELLARTVAAELGRPWRRLLRRRGLHRQVGRSRVQRQALPAGRFQVRPRSVAGRILVVDDVLTTGATLGQVAGALLAAGAESVYCAALVMAPAARRMT